MSTTTAGGVRSRVRRAASIGLVVSPVSVAGSLWLARAYSGVPGEFTLFGNAGAAVLGGRFGDVYSSPLVQAGPFELLPYGAARLLGISTVPGWGAFYAVFGVVAAAAFAFAVLTVLPNRTGLRVVVIALVATLVAELTTALPRALESGHPAHVAIPVLWVLAGLAARRGGFVAAGLLLATSAGFETWGLLGVPVLLLGDLPRLWRAAVALVAGIAVLYLPFALTGSFAMFEMTWGVRSSSPLTVLAPHVTVVTFPLRLAQGVLAVAAGTATALIARHRLDAVWLVALAILALRLAVDPLEFGYYFISPGLALIGLAASVAVRASRPGSARRRAA